jgi:hypothetical protein
MKGDNTFWSKLDHFKLLNEFFEKILFILTIFLIASQLDTGKLKIAYIGMILLFINIKKIDKSILFLIGIFLIGFFNAFIYLTLNNISLVETTNLLLRNVLYFIEIFFAIAVYMYLSRKSLKEILSILKYALLLNVIVGVFQLLIFHKLRLNFLFSEPSSAGFFYCFMIFIIIYKMEKSKVANTFKYLGLMIMSKAQFLVLGIIWFYRRTFKTKIIFILLGILIIAFLIPYLRAFTVFNQIFIVITSLGEYGIKGLSLDFGIYDSFVVRLSGIIVAFHTLLEYPFGIGWGSFNSHFVNYVHANDLQYYLHGREIEGIISGEFYATPKSHLMELFVSTGIFGVAFIISLFRIFHKSNDKYIFYAFISTILASLVIELAPFYLYLIILIVLLKKETQYNEGAIL